MVTQIDKCGKENFRFWCPPPPKSVLFALSGLILWVSEKCPIRYLLLHLRVRSLSLSVSRKHHKQDRFRSSVGAIKGRKLRRRICRERPVQHIHTWRGERLPSESTTPPPTPPTPQITGAGLDLKPPSSHASSRPGRQNGESGSAGGRRGEGKES